MKNGPFRFVESPLISMGEHPKTGRIVGRGMLFTAMLAGIGSPSKAHDPVYTFERVGVHVELRMWARGADVPIWLSAGIYRIGLHRWALIWIRAAFRRRKREREFPRARKIERGPIARMFREE